MKVKVELELQFPMIHNHLRTNPENDVANIDLGQLSETELELFLSEYSDLYRERWMERKLKWKADKIRVTEYQKNIETD